MHIYNDDLNAPLFGVATHYQVLHYCTMDCYSPLFSFRTQSILIPGLVLLSFSFLIFQVVAAEGTQ